MTVWIILKWAMIVVGSAIALAIALMLYVGITLTIQGKRSGGASLWQAWRELGRELGQMILTGNFRR